MLQTIELSTDFVTEMSDSVVPVVSRWSHWPAAAADASGVLQQKCLLSP